MKTMLATAALMLGLLISASLAHGQAKAEKDIVDTAVAAGSFKTLVAAVQHAGLVDALKSEGPFTVFAPTDDAFAKFPPGVVPSLLRPENKDDLVGILTYHVVPDRLSAEKLARLERIQTLNGQRPTLRNDGESIMIDKATVIAADINTSNGVIHVIDTVILPSKNDVVGTASKTGSFNTLTDALETAGLASTLRGKGPFTLFAPNDEAFAKLPEGTLENLLKPENKDKLAEILSHHVVSGAVYSDDIHPGKVGTLQGSALNVKKDGDSLLVDDAHIVVADISATNGVVHFIDSVILPAEGDR